MRYELVIFDNDGVLVDSEPIANQILAAYLTELGHPTTYEESLRDFMGGAKHRIHETVLERSGKRLPAGFDATFDARVFEEFRGRLAPVVGVAEVLDKLAADGVPYCVGSSGSHERIRVALTETGLFERFAEGQAGGGGATGRIFSSEDVGRGKPTPDLFLHAAREMGVAPERCAVVEDSPLGVRAAIAAGMDVYGFTAMTPAVKLTEAGATTLFGDMAELPALFAGEPESGAAVEQ
ncbi:MULTISPECIES: HAD family phosphatase [unclassified Streptomyces]|uniref:HAD family hydrolase n=1 Tax=unclassified Streptomyces TaxID=2593676 RepID=UPI00088E24F8|nr:MULTISPECIES: HAD family hydrolase [unclassified Streptomyces]PBC83315.1 HAD superfamily hydrolase (TIGR01509 family) [Streptomyces sp. 2321.6]SDR43459.1 haloacid dehalogenase superfamily, subfamily IA, variant 3 with third motif having DD or ED [Streptomyces sp. KS_16]SEC92183.1 haloacid dehalogenase superfamily, subfamily IA, variant 3 with third motif having DD or ED [Streptomyces sp. 2133.1]SEE81058.1 haloacid dehalogenase superfamily, subfamily IA, variant 3 with third motif having DD o